MELYMLAYAENGVLTGRFVCAGRPSTPRVYGSLESAKRGLKQVGHRGEIKIVRIARIEEVTE